MGQVLHVRIKIQIYCMIANVAGFTRLTLPLPVEYLGGDEVFAGRDRPKRSDLP
jgi:hypothetical protein